MAPTGLVALTRPPDSWRITSRIQRSGTSKRRDGLADVGAPGVHARAGRVVAGRAVVVAIVTAAGCLAGVSPPAGRRRPACRTPTGPGRSHQARHAPRVTVSRSARVSWSLWASPFAPPGLGLPGSRSLPPSDPAPSPRRGPQAAPKTRRTIVRPEALALHASALARQDRVASQYFAAAKLACVLRATPAFATTPVAPPAVRYWFSAAGARPL